MSPGPTFERVYLELKRQLREGVRPPGAPLEPTAIGDELGSSFTPVRDALHRLVGEGLVENPRHNGFAVPRPTEQALRDLYSWNGDLLAMMIGHLRADALALETGGDSADPPTAIDALFLAIAGASGNREHSRTILQLNERLAPYRRVEAAILSQVGNEAGGLLQAVRSHVRVERVRGVVRYHKRRVGAVPDILAALSTD